jgi:FtsZ-interacting cell division protein YlmF
MYELFWDYFQAEEIEEKKKETEGDDVDKKKMEVDEDKPTPAPADQDSSSSQTQKSEPASDGPEGTAPVTDNAENAEVRSIGQIL